VFLLEDIVDGQNHELLSEKIAIVTGASSGIGYATSKLFASVAFDSWINNHV